MSLSYEAKGNIEKSKKAEKSNEEFLLNDIDVEKIVATLDTVTTILKNKKSIEFLISQFKSNPNVLVGLLSKASSLKGVLNSSDIDLSSIINGLQEKKE